MTKNNRTRESAELIQAIYKDFCKQKKLLKNQQHISSARIEVIDYLRNTGPNSLKEIADYRKVTPATMSRLVASLIEDGLVLKANSKIDHRSKIFLVTNKGKQLLEVNSEQELNLLISNIKKLSVEEQSNIQKSAHLVRKIIASSD